METVVFESLSSCCRLVSPIYLVTVIFIIVLLHIAVPNRGNEENVFLFVKHEECCISTTSMSCKIY